MTEQDDPPKARYRLTLEVDGNTHDELLEELHYLLHGGYVIHTNGYERDEADWYGGRLHARLEQMNPDQTPERYEQELHDWSERRREARRARNDA